MKTKKIIEVFRVIAPVNPLLMADIYFQLTAYIEESINYVLFS